MINAPETLYAEMKMLDRGIMPKPRAAFFTPTYRCNQNCYYCFYKDWNNKGTEEHSERIPQILKQLKDLGVKSVEFEGGGDPLMTPYIEQHFRTTADLGMRLGLLTNGALFKGEIAETYLKLGTYVRFSLDTANPETYKKTRGTDDCEKVLKNISNALKMREELNSECEISVKIGVSEHITPKDISETCAHFKDSGVDSIQIKGLWDKAGKHYGGNISRADLGRLGGGHGASIIRKMSYPRLMNEPCWITPVQIAVDVHGDFYLCVYYMHRKDALRVGNMFEKPLTEMWGGKEHLKKISKIKISECLAHDCRFQKYMRAIRKMERLGTWEFI